MTTPEVGNMDGDTDKVSDIETLRLVHREIRDRLTRFDAYTARLEAKATTLLGFVSATSLFLAAQRSHGTWTILAYVSLFLGAVAAFAVLVPLRYSEAPEPSALIRHAEGREETTVYRLLHPALEQGFSSRSSNHTWKVTSWYVCFCLFVSGVILTVVAIALE